MASVVAAGPDAAQRFLEFFAARIANAKERGRRTGGRWGRLRRGPVPAARAVHIGALLADALAALHEAGYMHGDIKPSNVGFTSDGSPKLLDFGLARETSDAAATRGGTVRYLSPEVLSGRPADEADDVWSLCVMLHEIVSGEHPFAGNGVDEVTDRIRRQRLGRAAPGAGGSRRVVGLDRVHGVHARRPPVGSPGNGPGPCRRASRCSPTTVGPSCDSSGCDRSLCPSRTSVSIESGVLQTRQRIAAMRVNG